MRTRNLNKIAFIFALIFLVSCDNNKVYDEYIDLESTGWSTADTLAFEIELNSTNGGLFDFLIGLRNNNEYLYSNIFLFVELENPQGITLSDTLQYLVAEPNGKWKGSGVGAIKYNLFKYKESQELEDGLYKIKITHGMRSELLHGLEDIGLRIESVN